MQPTIHCQYTRLVQPQTLKPHPRNPNTHPDKQIKLLAKILKAQGWRHPIVVSKRSGYVVAGHGRLMAARYAEFDTVPIDEQNFSDEVQELEYLVADNQIQEFAEMDMAVLDEITQELMEMEIDMELLGMEDKDVKKVEREAAKEETVGNEFETELPGVHALKDNVIFPSKAVYDIPEFLPNMLAECPTPIQTWIGPQRTELWDNYYLFIWANDSVRDMALDRTVICFYTEDEKFESCWWDAPDFASRLLNMKPHSCVSPNFSSWPDTPRAVKIYNTYRARWAGRFWQEAGIRVIPDIDISTPDAYEWCFAGVPKNAPCLSFQDHVKKKSIEEEKNCISGFLAAIDQLKPQSLLIYAGERSEELLEPALPKQLHRVYVMNAITRRRAHIKKQKA